MATGFTTKVTLVVNGKNGYPSSPWLRSSDEILKLGMKFLTMYFSLPKCA